MIDLIDHFSKFLMSIPVKNNNAENILISLKQYFNNIGMTKIFQSDNGYPNIKMQLLIII